LIEEPDVVLWARFYHAPSTQVFETNCLEPTASRELRFLLIVGIQDAGAVYFRDRHNLAVEPSRSYPILIGFSNEIEREFFEQFITVSGVGPRAAVRALTIPISTIAKAIDRGDLVVLKSLPGIGIQRARDIVAKLQGKIGKFALMQDEQAQQETRQRETDIESEAIEVLLQLQYSRQEAKVMIERALERNREVKTAEELLNEVYKQRAQVAGKN
jgi:Holliday junction DNA helicase RuvA